MPREKHPTPWSVSKGCAGEDSQWVLLDARGSVVAGLLDEDDAHRIVDDVNAKEEEKGLRSKGAISDLPFSCRA